MRLIMALLHSPQSHSLQFWSGNAYRSTRGGPGFSMCQEGKHDGPKREDRLQRCALGVGGMDAVGHPVPAGLRKSFGAADSRRPAAAEAVERIDYNWARMRRWIPAWANQFMVALRAKQLDVWAADFLNRHPNAVVPHLRGLDSRVFRLEPPATCSGSTWTCPTSSSCGAGCTRTATAIR